MPFRPAPTAPIPTYRPYHVNAAATAAAAGMLFDGTSATAVAAPGTQAITLTLVDGDYGVIQPGDILIVDTGAACEAAPVTAVNIPAKQITCTFANTHSGTYPVRLAKGSYLGSIAVGAVGTSATLTLYNGHPNNNGKTIAVITPATPGYTFNCALDQGLFYTYAASAAGDVTIMALPAFV